MNIKIIIIGTAFASITTLSVAELKHKDIVELIKENRLNLDDNIPYDGDNYRVSMFKYYGNRVQYELEKSVTLLKIFTVGTESIFADESTKLPDAYIKRKRIYSDTYQNFVTSLGLGIVAGLSIVSIILGFHWMIKDVLKSQKNQ